MAVIKINLSMVSVYAKLVLLGKRTVTGEEGKKPVPEAYVPYVLDWLDAHAE